MRLLDEMFRIVSMDSRKVVLQMNADHPIYAIHFPGTPITPGVCIVQMLGELLERQTGYKLELSKIVNLKFVHTLSPTEEGGSPSPAMTVNFTSVTNADTCIHAKGDIKADGQVATKFSLIFSCK